MQILIAMEAIVLHSSEVSFKAVEAEGLYCLINDVQSIFHVLSTYMQPMSWSPGA